MEHESSPQSLATQARASAPASQAVPGPIPELDNVAISNFDGNGLTVEDGARLRVNNDEFSDNGGAGISLASGSHAEINNLKANHNKGPGLVVRDPPRKQP
jgi:hypothetical protein